MPDEQKPPNEGIDEVNARLSDSLKTCRSMVANYKALILSDHNQVEPPDGSLPPDTAISAPVQENSEEQKPLAEGAG